jgi:hypothetical protein
MDCPQVLAWRAVPSFHSHRCDPIRATVGAKVPRAGCGGLQGQTAAHLGIAWPAWSASRRLLLGRELLGWDRGRRLLGGVRKPQDGRLLQGGIPGTSPRRSLSSATMAWSSVLWAGRSTSTVRAATGRSLPPRIAGGAYEPQADTIARWPRGVRSPGLGPAPPALTEDAVQLTTACPGDACRHATAAMTESPQGQPVSGHGNHRLAPDRTCPGGFGRHVAS